MWSELGTFARTVAGSVHPVWKGFAMRNLSLKYGPRLAALGAGVLPVVSFAEVPAAFTGAITDATADGAAMAVALLGVTAAVVLVMIGIKFIKRIKGAV